MNDADYDLFVSYTFNVKFVRVFDNLLMPTRLEIRTEVERDADVDEDKVHEAFTRIRYWFDNIVAKCLVFCASNGEAIDMFIDDDGVNRSSNLIMLTPEEPTDEHLAAIFQAKLNALADGALSFGLVEVISDNTVGLSFTFVGDGETCLPSIAEWLGEPYYFDKPWWSRNDSSTLDVTPGEDADLTKPPSWAYSLDFLSQTVPEETVIIRPEFRPTVIDGGKSKGDPEG